MQERFAATFGLLAFIITVLGGLVRKTPFADTLLYALAAMVAFTLIGWGVGRIGALLVGEYIQQKEPPTPIPAQTSESNNDVSQSPAEAEADIPAQTAAAVAPAAGRAKR